MAIIDSISGEDGTPTAADVRTTVEYTRRLLTLAAEIFPRIQKAGPKGHNHISGWVKLSSYDLTHLEKKYWGENTARRSVKSAVRVAVRIAKLFTGAVESWDEKTDSRDQLQTEISHHDFSNGLNEDKLILLRKYFGFLAFSDPVRKTEMKFILRVCQKLIGQPTGDRSNAIIAQQNHSGKPVKSASERNWFLTSKGLVAGSAVFLITATLLLSGVFPLAQKTIILPASSAASNKEIKNSIITKSEARYRLDVLWENGHSFADSGNDEPYFSSMKTAYDLAEEVFGPDSIEFARASNHMVGAYETTGHQDNAIDTSRQALRLFQNILGPKSPEALGEQVNLGARLARKSSVAEKQESRDLLVDAVAKYASMDKVFSMRRGYAHALEAYAIYYEEIGDWSNAVLQSEKSVAMVESANVTGQINRGWIIANHAHMLLRSGNCKAAVAMYQRAIAAYVQAKVPDTQRDHAYGLLQISRGCE